MTDLPRVQVRVSVQPGKPALRELLIDGLKVYEFPNRAQYVDFVMQAASTLRYD